MRALGKPIGERKASAMFYDIIMMHMMIVLKRTFPKEISKSDIINLFISIQNTMNHTMEVREDTGEMIDKIVLRMIKEEGIDINADDLPDLVCRKEDEENVFVAKYMLYSMTYTLHHSNSARFGIQRITRFLTEFIDDFNKIGINLIPDKRKPMRDCEKIIRREVDILRSYGLQFFENCGHLAVKDCRKNNKISSEGSTVKVTDDMINDAMRSFGMRFVPGMEDS